MQLRVVHTTGFTYDGVVPTSYNHARLTPQNGPGQIVLHTRLDVDPRPWTYTYRDYHGAQVTAFELSDPHESLTVTATSSVQTSRRPAPGPQLTWDALLAEDTQDTWIEFLALAPRVAVADEMAARVRPLREAHARPGEAARAVCDLVHAEIEYVTGSTDVRGRAAEAWAQRRGVCQDMAHLAAGAMRMLGIPARYVSGYVHPAEDPPVGEQVAGESHAWVEWWDGEWQAWDPTNDAEPGDRWIVLATGRDYDDVKPLSGVYAGSAGSAMFVDVQMTLLP